MSRATTRHRARLLAVPGVLLALVGAGATLLVPVGIARTTVSPTASATGEPTGATEVPASQALLAQAPLGARLGSPRTGPRPERDRIDDGMLSRTRPVLVADGVYDPPPAAPVAAEIPVAAGAGVAAAAVALPTPRLSIAALGINRPIDEFPCDRAAPPDDLVYRWGCAGTNNLYLLGHAASVFKPLHDAYVAGRLKVGMEASLVNASGQVETYHVTTWRLVRPDDAAWAIADQPVPSMTLQTCVGAHSEYRLVVRLVA